MLSANASAQGVLDLDAKFMSALENSASTDLVVADPDFTGQPEFETVNYTTACDSRCDAWGDSCCPGTSCAADDCWSSPSLLGDPCGTKAWLSEQGIIADLQLTQFYQGVSSGGANRNFEYGGKLDYNLTFVGEKIGLNKGFMALLHAERRFGDDINADAGPLALPNGNMLYPLPGEHVGSITGLMFMQALSEQFVLTAGKYNLLDLWHMLYPQTGRGIDGFMSTGMLAPIPLLRTTNLTINGAGAMVMHGKEIQGAVLVYDTNNSSTTVGLSDIYAQGAVVLGYWRFFTEIGGHDGSHAFVGNWSSRSYASTDRTSWTIIPGEGVMVGQETGSWTVGYILDQELWSDRCNKDRNIRLMSQWMIADGNPNPYRWSGNVALQGTGLICGREQDTMGVGYFFNGLSSEFKDLVSPLVDVRDIQGAEIYYNAAITPWFHLTADLQIVENAISGDDAAIIPGLRANVRF